MTQLEQYERSKEARKIMSWRLTELIDAEVADNLGMTPSQAIDQLRYALRDYPVEVTE